MPRQNMQGHSPRDSDGSAPRAPPAAGCNSSSRRWGVQRIPISHIRPNLGAPPPPSVQEAAEQLERLWPIEKAVAEWGFPRQEHRTLQEDTEVGLLCTMLRQGCTGWNAEARHMYEGSKKKLRDGSTRLRFLASKDGGVVFWLWTLGENMSGSDIVGYLRKYLPIYWPFVHKIKVSVKVALAAYGRIQHASSRRGYQTLQLSVAKPALVAEGVPLFQDDGLDDLAPLAATARPRRS